MEKIIATIDLIDGSEVEVKVEVDLNGFGPDFNEDEMAAEVINTIKEEYPQYRDKIKNITI